METNGEKVTGWLKQLIDIATAKRAMVAAIVFASLIGPGFLALYRFEPAQVQALDFGKIILFCFSISVPSVLVCAVLLFLVVDAKTMNDEGVRQRLLISSAGLSALFLYAAHGIVTKEAGTPTLRQFVGTAMITHMLGLVAFLGIALRNLGTAAWKRRRTAASQEQAVAPVCK